MTPGTKLTNEFLAKTGELWPLTVRLWRSNAGKGIGMSVVHQALACLEENNVAQAISLLRRPISFGVSGGCDLTGLLKLGPEQSRFIGCEIKAGKDRLSERQLDFHKVLRDFGGIVIVVRDLDQGLADLSKYAGAGVSR